MRKNILLLETVAEEALQLLSEKAQVLTAYGNTPLEKILSSNEIHAVITRGKGQVNRQLMEACPYLEVAARCGVGLDNVDVQEATSRGIKIINAPGSNAATIAEHTLTLMLMLVRNVYEWVNKVKEGNWEKRNNYQGDELAGKTLGILGMGNIGSRVARLGEAFGMEIIYWSRSASYPSYIALSLKEVLQQSDVVSLHLPFTKETENLLGEKELAFMHPGAILINTARGNLIDQQALYQALEQGIIAGFGADVLETEPPSTQEPLIRHPRVLVTPHVGSLTATTYRNMCVVTVQNVLAVLDNKKPSPESIFNRKALGIEI